jgi:hypothetical protein
MSGSTQFKIEDDWSETDKRNVILLNKLLRAPRIRYADFKTRFRNFAKFKYNWFYNTYKQYKGNEPYVKPEVPLSDRYAEITRNRAADPGVGTMGFGNRNYAAGYLRLPRPMASTPGSLALFLPISSYLTVSGTSGFT